ncbi:MAG: hypothetical protein E7320_12510 [Clostridiales bacterium]|nr:hypothetical protein [Clostridiales bacterium]
MKNNVISIDFSNPAEKLLQLARESKNKPNTTHTMALYRAVLEKDMRHFEAGLELAVLLWKRGQWQTSYQECCRLYALWPNEEKLFGLMYRNLLAIGLEDDARFAYERYMLHLYHHPEDGLNLGESDPPIPEKPTRNRYERLLDRAMRHISTGRLDRANRLLCHANRRIFPSYDLRRSLLEVHLMHRMGMDEEAIAIVDGMVQAHELTATFALEMMELMYELRGPEYAGRLLLYAASVAENCMEVHEVMRTALYYGQPSLAESMLADLLGQHADRLDAVYDMAVIAAWRDERARACELSQMCMEAAPTCAEVNGLYQLFKTDMRENKGKAISGMPLRPYGSGSGISRMMDALHFAEMNDQELLRAMTAYPLQPRLVDAMVAMPPALQERTIGLAAQLEAADEEAFLRLCLLWSGLSLPMCWSIVKRLRELGVTGPVVADADHRLQTLDPQEDA